MEDERAALARIAAHERLCTERWEQLRDSLKEHRSEFKAFRRWFFTGLIGILLTVVGAFGWLVVERVLSGHQLDRIEQRQ